MQAKFISGEPRMVPHTPSGADVAAGQVVAIGDGVFIAHRKIVDGELGALAAFGGVYEVTAGEAIAQGKKVYWDDSGDKVVETATTGKLAGIVLPGESAAADGDTLKILHWQDAAASTPAAVVAALTDNSAGTANDTLQALADGTTYATDVAAIRNNFADLAAKVNAILTALKNAGLMKTA